MKALLVAMCFLMQSCYEPRKVSQLKQDLRWNSDTKFVERGGFGITIRVIPKMLRVLESSRFASNEILSNQEFKRVQRSAAELRGVMFLLNITPTILESDGGKPLDLIFSNASGFQDYKEAIQAYQFGLMKNIWLESSGIKVPAVSSQMINNFGMDPGRDFVLEFPDIGSSEKFENRRFYFVMDNIVPGLGRERVQWEFSKRKYESAI